MKDMLRLSNNPGAMAQIHDSVTNGKSKEELRDMMLNEDFIKTVEHEYAVQYLTRMGLETSQPNITSILREHPL
jgi:hypothetical protein